MFNIFNDNIILTLTKDISQKYVAYKRSVLLTTKGILLQNMSHFPP